MAFSHSVVALLLVSVLFMGYAQSEAPLTQFSKVAQTLLPDDTHEKVFAANADDTEQLLKATQKATDKFDEILGSEIDKSLQKQLVAETKRLGLDGVTRPELYHVYGNAIGNTLKDNGKLDSNNIEDMAKKWVDELNKSASSLESSNILSTLPALTAANARFLKSVGLTSKDNLNQFAKNLINELDKY